MEPNAAVIWSGWLAPIHKLQASLERSEQKKPSGDQRRALDRKWEKLEQIRAALARLEQWDEELYRGVSLCERSHDDINELVTVVCANSDGYVYRNVHRYLIQGLERGIKALDWKLPLPAPLSVNRTEPSNLTPEVGQRLIQFDRLEEAFWESLSAPRPQLDRLAMEFDAGQLLYSFVAHSGVLNQNLIERLPAAIQAGVRIEENIVWLDLDDGRLGESSTVEGAQKPLLKRRIFPAPVTQLLLRRWHEHWKKQWPTVDRDRPDRYPHFKYLLKPYVAQLALRADLPPAVAQDVVGIAQAAAACELPISLVNYCRNTLLGVPVSPENWCRVLTGKRQLPEAEQESTDEDVLGQTQCMNVQPKTEFSDQQTLLESLRAGIRTTKRKACVGWIAQFIEQEDVSPILKLMGHWAQYMIISGGKKKDSLLLMSISDYLLSIKPLLDHAEVFVDPFGLDADTWQSVYDNIVNQSYGGGERSYRLGMFHEFLETVYNVPPVDIDGSGRISKVDARILTPEEYRRARLLLQKKAQTDRWAPLQEVLLIMGYRCGLRRNEALSRLFADFPGIDDPVIDDVRLLVRPNKNGQIKSDAGTRSLRLRHLLTSHELECLARFYAERREVIPGHPEMWSIFSEHGAGSGPVQSYLVFKPLTRLLQEITGDPAFRFHNLRHSFVSWTLLRLLESRPGEHMPPRCWTGALHHEELLATDRPFWKTLGYHTQSQALWALAAWAGHASPTITLQKYAHLVDWLVRSHLWNRRNPELTVQEQADLLGKSVAAVEKHRYRKKVGENYHRASDLAQSLIDRWPSKGQRKNPPLNDVTEVSIEGALARDASDRHQVRYLDAYKLMLATEADVPVGEAKMVPRGLKAAADLCEVRYQDAIRWHCNAVYVMSLRTHKKRARPASSLATPGHFGSRMSREDELVLRPLNEKDMSKGPVELRSFISPPNTPDTRSYAHRFFYRLLDWYEEKPEEALDCIWNLLSNSTRSDSKPHYPNTEGWRRHYRFLCELQLKSRCTIDVRVNKQVDEKATIKHWAEVYGTEPRYVRVIKPTRKKRYENLVIDSVSVRPPGRLNKKQNLLWRVMRFVAMTVYVIKADPSEEARQLYEEQFGLAVPCDEQCQAE
ncbi:site-specific integrase [Marinobacter persicus]|uniref:Phage integrase family protein n=1 Tax=Marinobacter persicus TaxID=930118 RepID=A0A2S6G3W0_9GAMM|nr:site-specific integrase [Marinobacter persicus]PPK50485.1 hypothetical protein BY455_12545 [Marinobacter persicus]PPK53767.1 hypothetical protein B0H24_102545 [Marinobacter persicus]PPK56962.1 hypothetical protein BY454_1275 [Marinobacter persicus]